jgi:hypothetical protein
MTIKERPILFSGPMVRALLDGSKTQTRRPVKGFALELLKPDNFTHEYVALPENGNSPYGYVGDRLWVRETFVAFGRWETRFNEKKGRDEWHFVDMTMECDRAYQYTADEPDVPLAWNRDGMVTGWWRRPSIFMPRDASRITLEVTGVRVERLQEIGETAAIAEGIGKTPAGFWSTYGRSGVDGTYSPRSSFRCLWESINGAESWDADPWVWVVEFKRVSA